MGAVVRNTLTYHYWERWKRDTGSAVTDLLLLLKWAAGGGWDTRMEWEKPRFEQLLESDESYKCTFTCV